MIFTFLLTQNINYPFKTHLFVRDVRDSFFFRISKQNWNILFRSKVTFCAFQYTLCMVIILHIIGNWIGLIGKRFVLKTLTIDNDVKVIWIFNKSRIIRDRARVSSSIRKIDIANIQYWLVPNVAIWRKTKLESIPSDVAMSRCFACQSDVCPLIDYSSWILFDGC